MLALCGFPLMFSGFWSKDEILHAAHGWPVSHIPFYLGVAGAFLTAFYMTRQVALVFFGKNRASEATREVAPHHGVEKSTHAKEPHESPAVMTWPLVILAFFAVTLGFIGTPAWPWFQSFLGKPHEAGGGSAVPMMILSSIVVFIGLGVGWWLYGRKPIQKADEPDSLEKLPMGMYTWFAKKYGIDELYELTVIRFNAWGARVSAFLDEWVWGGAVMLVSYLMLGFSWVNRAFDEFVINLGFDKVCTGLRRDGAWLSLLQSGRVQIYLRVIGVALAALVLFLVWGGGK
jgi:NADH-quinone oxidoreductase subunit L